MATTTTGTLRASTYALVQLLRVNVGSLQQRVYPQGEVISPKETRATVRQLTPREQIAGLGNSVVSFSTLQLVVDVWDKNQAKVDSVADDVIQVIKQNRNYSPTTITIGVDASVNPKGNFLMLSLNGGSENAYNPQMQCYHRAINVTGLWFQSS